jgi:amino acid transporter
MWTQCFVILIAILRLFNLNILAKFSTVLMLMSVIPTLMYIGFMLPHDADGSVWLSTTGKSNCTGLLNASYGLTSPLHESHYAHCEKTDLDLGELFPQMLFIWGGFNALGTLAGEVQNPGRNIPLSTLILLPGIFLIYVVPMIVSLPIEPDQTQYVSGFYGTLAERIVGKWFKMVLTISAVASLFGYTNATIIVSDESFQGFCLRRRPKFFARIRKSGNRFKRWLFDTENRVAPSIALFNSIFLSAAVLLPYQFLISASMVLGNIGMILTFGAYIRLKKSQPDASWVYKFTWHRAILLAFCPAIVVLMQAGLALFDYPVTLGIPFINLVSTAGIIGTGLTAHGIYSLFARKYKIKSLLTDEGDLDNSGESKPLLINKEY